MRPHLSVRTLVYSVVAVAAVALAISGFTIYLRGFTVPHAILNSRIVETIASRWGIRYSLRSLQIGCLARNCAGAVDAGGIEVELQTPVPFRIHLNDAEWRRAGGFTVGGLEFLSGDRPPLISVDGFQIDPAAQQAAGYGLRIGLLPNTPPVSIDTVDFDGAERELIARRIGLQLEGRPPVGVEQIHLDGRTAPAADGWFTLDRIDVAGVDLSLETSATNATLCEELPSTIALGREAAAGFRPLVPFVRETILTVQGDLFRVALAMAAVILGLKFLSVLWLRRWLALGLLAAIPGVTPFAIYFALRGTLSPGNLFVVAGGYCLA